MFSNLMVLHLKRSGSQAFGFYIAYLVLFLLAGALLGGLIALVLQAMGRDPLDLQVELTIGTIFACVATMALSFGILEVKGLLKRFPLVLLAIASGLLAILGGGALGLIPVAYMTTLAPRSTMHHLHKK